MDENAIMPYNSAAIVGCYLIIVISQKKNLIREMSFRVFALFVFVCCMALFSFSVLEAHYSMVEVSTEVTEVESSFSGEIDPEEDASISHSGKIDFLSILPGRSLAHCFIRYFRDISFSIWQPPKKA
ncbi:MAG: hypothetical protein KKA07_05900 [Bacteroidetes bacterium]|nr:hypothetical protein [Bacteroidota bacterium]MBU1718588.1 hypothetical protein [Bacteroidota bacterium]